MNEQLSATEPTGSSVHPLGKYLVLAALGRGGMAEVHLAVSRQANGFSKLVVLKLLRSHLAENSSFLEMFIAEARLAARLNHANIVQTYEVGEGGGRHCIVMEYLEGRPLTALWEAAKHQNLLHLGVRALAEMLSGLHYAHELRDVDGQPLGIIHRDISPQNVFVTYDGQVKLLDFGIAKAANSDSLTETGVFKGKIRYTAPERFADEGCDRRSDIFSVGVMLWQLLTKRSLWEGVSDLAIMQKLVSNKPIPSPRSVDPTVPALLDEICNKALATSRADRFSTAAEMADALEEYLASDSLNSLKTTNRTFAKFMNEQFGEERRKFQRKIDERMRAAALLPLPSDSDPSVSINRIQVAPREPSHGFDSVSSIPAATSDPPAAPRRRWAGVIVAGLVASASIGVAAVYSHRGASKPPPSESPVTAVPVASAPIALPPATNAPAGSVTLPARAEEASTREAIASARHPLPVAPPAQRTTAAVGRAARGAPPVGATPSSSSPPVEPSARTVDCTSPYFLDDGVKKIRPECL